MNIFKILFLYRKLLFWFATISFNSANLKINFSMFMLNQFFIKECHLHSLKN